MYQLKHLPEDFIVKERTIFVPQENNNGKYIYFQLTKKNWNTLDIIQKLADILHLKEKQLGFAGSKDRKAVTTQLISIIGTTKENVQRIYLPDMTLTFVGTSNEPLCLGNLDGNDFEITIRNLEPKEIEKEEFKEINFTPNYFDEQRFGSNNALIGKALLQKNFAAAVKLIDNAAVQERLQEYPQDFVGAIKKQPPRLLKMYVNAYQSEIWNKTLAEYLKQNGTVIKTVPNDNCDFVFTKETFPELKIPLVGFGTDDSNLDPSIQKIISDILDQEKLQYYDFIIKQIPELTLEGEMRNAFVEVKDFQMHAPEKDELNEGKMKVFLTFGLPKGSYATMVVKRIFE